MNLHAKFFRYRQQKNSQGGFESVRQICDGNAYFKGIHRRDEFEGMPELCRLTAFDVKRCNWRSAHQCTRQFFTSSMWSQAHLAHDFGYSFRIGGAWTAPRGCTACNRFWQLHCTSILSLARQLHWLAVYVLPFLRVGNDAYQGHIQGGLN